MAAAADGPAFTSTPTVMVYAMYLRRTDSCMRVVQPKVEGATLYHLASAPDWISQTQGQPRRTTRAGAGRAPYESLR